MGRRLKLHEILSGVVQLYPDNDLLPNEELYPLGQLPTYFQPPTNTKMKYPCIVYSRDNSWVARADSEVYLLKKRYQVTVIDRDPDSPLPDLVEMLPLTRADRVFVSGGLYHFQFQMFF